jgi:predicted trehalose synthase
MLPWVEAAGKHKGAHMEGWTDRQLAEEREMSRLGEERYKGKVANALRQGRETDIGPGKQLLRASVATLTETFREFIKSSKGVRGKPHTMVSVFKEIKPDVAALITAKAVLDSLTQEQNPVSSMPYLLDRGGLLTSVPYRGGTTVHYGPGVYPSATK